MFVAIACGDDDDEDKTPSGGLSGKLEIFSWWTTGGEAAGLQKLYELYPNQCGGTVNIVNSTVAGGGGAQARQVLTTRMLGNDPPGSFQVHMGHELIDSWVTTNYMEPLDSLFKEQGWNDVFPKGVLDIVSYQGKPYAVPVNIHRANVLWYNKAVFTANGLQPPKTLDDFFKVADALKAKGITPLALGDVDSFASIQLMETVLLGKLGATAYNGLWTGATDWKAANVTDALNAFKKTLDYVNSDHSSLSWDQANDLVISGKAAMTIMGDWLEGDMKAKNFTNYGWLPSPGTEGVYDALSDTFGLPKNAPNKAAVLCWLKVVGSKAGQEAFNPLKGSICARTDCNPSLFDAYLQSAMTDWKANTIVPSLAHGAAVKPGWLTEISDAVTAFVANKDAATLQNRLAAACKTAGVCK
ncbi:MAG: carbohydrate ABC transporter substrate-binding protein [Chloroflexi bacterium]|nr:carbohydrate ABC transporter substrate-binding protein [Chloroflexota bacterium]